MQVHRQVQRYKWYSKYSLKTDPVALTKKINFEVQKHSKTFARRLLTGSAYICCFLLLWEVIGE